MDIQHHETENFKAAVRAMMDDGIDRFEIRDFVDAIAAEVSASAQAEWAEKTFGTKDAS